MTMPLQFDKQTYLKILRDAGVAKDLADAHAEAIEAGLAQPIVLQADLALLKAEILARVHEMFREFEARIEAMFEARLEAMLAVKLRPIYVMTSISMALSMVSIALNCVILARL